MRGAWRTENRAVCRRTTVRISQSVMPESEKDTMKQLAHNDNSLDSSKQDNYSFKMRIERLTECSGSLISTLWPRQPKLNCICVCNIEMCYQELWKLFSGGDICVTNCDRNVQNVLEWRSVDSAWHSTSFHLMSHLMSSPNNMSSPEQVALRWRNSI